MLTLTNYRPLRLSEAMNRLFDESFVPGRPYAANGYRLPLDVVATEDEFVITAAVPGLRAEDLHVEVLGDTVTIRGEVAAPEADERAAYLLAERAYGKFARTLTLPAELNGAKAEAAMENGLLTLRVPKADVAKPKQIKVKAK